MKGVMCTAAKRQGAVSQRACLCVSAPVLMLCCAVLCRVVLQLGGPQLAGVGQPQAARGCGIPQGPLLHPDALQVSPDDELALACCQERLAAWLLNQQLC